MNEKEVQYPERKHTRLKHYDYSTTAAYFVTICTKGKHPLLSTVIAPPHVEESPSTVGRGLAPAASPMEQNFNLPHVEESSSTVGRGLAPAASPMEQNFNLPHVEESPSTVGRGLAPAAASASVQLTQIGEICENQLSLLAHRYPHIYIDDYVIMPDHIHAIIIFKNQTAGASPRPTLTDVICTYKSLTTREYKKLAPQNPTLFQTSFYEHVIRNRRDHDAIVKYIHENPINWIYDKSHQDI